MRLKEDVLLQPGGPVKNRGILLKMHINIANMFSFKALLRPKS